MRNAERCLSRVLGLTAAAVLIAAAGCGSPAEGAGNEEEEVRPVVLLPGDVATAERGEIAVDVVVTGSLEPHRVVHLTAQVPGVVVAMEVDRGVAVRAGQTLAVLEAEGIRGMAEAAASQLAVARQTLEGARTLHEAGAMSRLDYEGALAAYEAARAAAAGASETARRATIRSPLDGVVSARWASEGEAVAPGQPVLTVVDTRVLELRGQLPVEQAARVRPGQLVNFELSGFQGRSFQGEVTRVAPTADPQTRQVGVDARLANPGGLPGGLFARGRIDVERLTDVVVVPVAALRDGPDGPIVYVIEDGAIRHRPVRPGPADAARGLVAVLDGLGGGEQLLITPTVMVADGTAAELATAGGEAGRPAGEP